jgi:hypothetical protein
MRQEAQQAYILCLRLIADRWSAVSIAVCVALLFPSNYVERFKHYIMNLKYILEVYKNP